MNDLVPAPSPRKILTAISPAAWEHPADRAALQALRALPGVDEVFRKILGLLGGERGVRLLFQANAVRVGPSQLPRLWQLHLESCATLDCSSIPELYVSQQPFFNAGTYGVDRPFIVLRSAALELLDEAEMRVLLGHELGHALSGHALYRTMAEFFLRLGFSALPALAGLAFFPIQIAVLEWYRKSELSSDRAGLLASQELQASRALFMKMAGGLRSSALGGELDLDAFMAQAQEYAENKSLLDQVYKFAYTMRLTHPMHTVRAGELQQWIASGAYDRILAGDYRKRGQEEPQRPLREDMGDAACHYADEAKQTMSQVLDAAADAAEKIRDAFQRARNKGSGSTWDDLFR